MSKNTILLVDDDQTTLEVLSHYLERAGYKVHTCSNGKDALDFLMQNIRNIDLILLDVVMPGLNGFELATRLHASPEFCDTPILFLSGAATNQVDALKGFETGAVDFIIKPCDERVLLSRIKVFLKLKETLDSLKTTNASLEKEVRENLKNRQALEALNKNLEKRVAEETEKHLQKEQLLIQQSKMAAMGEMIRVIAHQWKQPLNSLNIIVQDIGGAFEEGEMDEEYISEITKNMTGQVTFMNETIDTFRNFFSPSKREVPFKVNEAIQQVTFMLSPLFSNEGIAIEYRCCGDLKNNQSEVPCDSHLISGYPNEFKQVLLNLFTNSRDAISECLQQGVLAKGEGKININVNLLKGYVRVEISDNGGGVPDKVLHKIFDPDFTTKTEGKGSGIGLYMAKRIMENNMGGKLFAENIQSGARFTIELPEKKTIT